MTFLKSSLILTALVLLFACDSTPKVATPPVALDVEKTPEHIAKTPLTLLEKARQAEDPEQHLLALLELTASQDCSKALKIAELIAHQVKTPNSQSRLYLAQAKCHFEQNNIVAAQQVIDKVDESTEYWVAKHQIIYDIARSNHDWWQAANAWYLISEQNHGTYSEIWNMLQQLPTIELESHSKELSPLSSVLQLLLIQRRLSTDQSAAKKDLERWLNEHSTHYFASQLPESFNLALDMKTRFNNIAVMLPLSGSRKSQGMAIKEGILSANFSHPDTNRELTFIDTYGWQTEPPEELAKYDLIIGPLLKKNVDFISPLVTENTTVLSLNRVDNPLFERDWYYFSLAPEDEAIQLTQYLANQGFKKPMLVVADGKAYGRMQRVFADLWQELTGTQPVALNFTNNKQLRQEMNDKFALSDSKTRIRQIRNLLRPELHSFERNRRDVDVIVVLANATQTELINPLIEASISPFAEIIPVFATSRSHSKFLSANGLRDLRNLYVIDMPWMLKTPQYAWLQQKHLQLWPDRRDTHNRLFALGYDAFKLASSLEFLASLPNQTWQGMTGTLQLDEQNQVTRVSTLAQFNEKDILPVASK